MDRASIHLHIPLGSATNILNMINERGHVKFMPKLLSSVKDNVVNLTGGSIGIGIPALN